MPRRRWTAAEKADVVLESLTTSIPVSELCRKYQISSSQFYTWRERFIQAGKRGLLAGDKSTREEELEKENNQLKGVIGELTLANTILKNARS
jgi:transposase-like protein